MMTKPPVAGSRVVLGSIMLACLALSAAPRTLSAQVPFFAAGATAFTPEIGVVNSGIVSDVQATVSADRRYVTLGMRQQNTELLALREFRFQQGNANFGAGGGNVGGAGAAEARAAVGTKKADPHHPAAAPDSDTPGVRAALLPPADRLSTPNPLDKPGMTRVDQR